MGIQNFKSIFYKCQRGLYFNKPKSWNIYVDGDLMMYKGCLSKNKFITNSEEYVTRYAIDYLSKCICILKNEFDEKYLQKIYIYFDGKRVLNKNERPKISTFDLPIIKKMFIASCSVAFTDSEKFEICKLQEGEAELQMYLQRDKNVNLNVFLTFDSDMLSICFDHEPNLIYNQQQQQQYQDYYFFEKIKKLKPININDNSICSITDLNYVYNDEYYKNLIIKDSCVWFTKINKNYHLVGFDYCKNFVGFNSIVFRTFVGLCGTDFTSSLLTDTMINFFINNVKEADKNFLNDLSEKYSSSSKDLRILVLFIFIFCFMGNEKLRLKQIYKNTTDGFGFDSFNFKFSHLTDGLETYRFYIESGKMNKMIEKIDYQVYFYNIIYLWVFGNYAEIKNSKKITKKDINNVFLKRKFKNQNFEILNYIKSIVEKL